MWAAFRIEFIGCKFALGPPPFVFRLFRNEEHTDDFWLGTTRREPFWSNSWFSHSYTFEFCLEDRI